MYLPKHFEETDTAVLHSLIRAHPLGAWVILADSGLVANHIPFLLKDGPGPLGTLHGHVARANAAWKTFSGRVPSLVIFQGAEAYITPSSYPGKGEHGKVVPTWNYAVVHAEGAPRIHDDREWLLGHVAELTAAHEAGEELPWKPSDAPPGFLDQMVAAIVGVEIPLDRLVGKWKIGQNRTVPDQLGAASGLRRKGGESPTAIAELMEANARRRS